MGDSLEVRLAAAALYLRGETSGLANQESAAVVDAVERIATLEAKCDALKRYIRKLLSVAESEEERMITPHPTKRHNMNVRELRELIDAARTAAQ